MGETGLFSPLFLDYLKQKESLKPFYGYFPTLDNIEDQIAAKQAAFPKETRALLVKVLEQQYAGVETSDILKTNIKSLGEENNFTITTGHQLNIFTGPLYFIYKI